MRNARPSARGAGSVERPRGRAYVQSTFNNTLITLTDPQGNALAWGSAGSAGTKGSRKSTPYAAQIAAEAAARKAMDHGLREVDVYVKGRAAAARLPCVPCRRLAWY